MPALALLVLYLATTSATPSVDAASASVQGWRIATSGTPWFEDVDRETLPFQYENPPLGISEAPNGHEVTHGSPGVTSFTVPAYLGASPDPRDVSIRRASALAAVLTWLSVLMMWRALLPWVGPHRAAMACVVMAIGTPVWSVAADAFWPHTITVFGAAGMTWCASRGRWFGAGLFGGLGLLGRLHFSVAVAVVGLWTGLRSRALSVTSLIAAGSVPFLFVAAAWSRWLYGQWDPAGGYSQVDAYADRAAQRSATETLTNFSGLLVSPDRGILVWSPVILVLLPALIRSWSSQPTWSRALLGGGVAYTLVQGFMSYFAGGSAFYGYRLTLELLVLGTPAFTIAAAWAGRRARAALPALSGLQVGAIAVGAVYNSLGVPIEQVWTTNSFVEILIAVPVLALPWLLCGALGVLAARFLRELRWVPGSAAQQPQQRG